MTPAKKMRDSRALRLALVGSDTLLGREIKDALDAISGSVSVENFAANGEGGFGEEEGEAVYRQGLSSRGAGLNRSGDRSGNAGRCAKSIRAFESRGVAAQSDRCHGVAGASARGPYLGSLLDSATAGARSGWLTVVAHPVSAAIALLMTKLSKLQPVERSVFHVFEPASERGGQGIAELQQQTSSLLAFRNLDKKIFDAQLSFNLLPAYGEDAPVKLSSVEQQIEMHLATLLARRGGSGVPAAMPSLRVIQAPVFHGYSVSAWIELSGNVDPATVAQYACVGPN